MLNDAPTSSAPAHHKASRVPDRSTRCPPMNSSSIPSRTAIDPKIAARVGNTINEMNSIIRDIVVSAANVRPRYSSTTFSCNSV